MSLYTYSVQQNASDVEDSIAIFIAMNKISQYCFLTKVKFLEKVKDFCPKM